MHQWPLLALEEVFAESYDNDGSGPVPPALKGISPIPIVENGTLIHEIAACPNLTNPYHECTAYCFERYGRRTFRASDQRMGRLRDRMLRRYPLPSHWLEVGDPVTGRFYYWNTVTDEVCWLSPLHPRAIVTKSASVLKAQTLAAKAAAAAASAAALAAGGLDGEGGNDKREGKRDRSRSPTPPPQPPATSQAPLLTSIMAPPSAPPPSYSRLGNSVRRAPKCEKFLSCKSVFLSPYWNARFSFRMYKILGLWCFGHGLCCPVSRSGCFCSLDSSLSCNALLNCKKL